MAMNILSWNVNGLRATYKNGHLDWLQDEAPDISVFKKLRLRKDKLKKL